MVGNYTCAAKHNMMTVRLLLEYLSAQMRSVAGNVHDGNSTLMPIGMAGKDLALAASHCQSCSQTRGNLQAVWKLMGDVHLQFQSTTPPTDAQLYTTHKVPDSMTVQSLESSLQCLCVQIMKLLSHSSNFCCA